MKTSRRHFLLLEVMIAFALVVACVIPMLRPHLYMLTEEKRFMREVELDRLVGVLYCDMLVERFYRPNITWLTITSGEPITIDDNRVANLGYSGTYRFKVTKKKGKFSDDFYSLDFLTITYTFKPTYGGEPLEYSYDLFVQRLPDTTVHDLPEGGTKNV